MFERSFFFWFPSVLIVIQNFRLSGGIVVEKWIVQYQDHFDHYNTATWLMRYYQNDEFYDQSGPIFIKIGGEYTIRPNSIGDSTSFIHRMAVAHGAMMYTIEHRYYGKSHPVPDTSFENLRYLSVQQVLADIALFIEFKKEELNNSNAFVMVFGNSYAGNLAAWMRVEYPNMVQGALAVSAPIYVKADFFEFYDSVEKSIRKYRESCANNIKEAFSALQGLLNDLTINSITVKNDFKLCSLPDFSQPLEISYLINSLANIFSHAVRYNNIKENGKTSIENLCNLMRKSKNIPLYHKLPEIFQMKFLGNNPCINFAYNSLVEKHLETSWESRRVEGRMWLYQTCTELGYRTTLSSKSIFGSLVSQKYFSHLCRDVFTANYTVDSLNHNIRIIHCSYNSRLSTTTNIIFTNGDLDPWRSLSVLSDLNADSPAILINGISHCGFLEESGERLTDSFFAARCKVSFTISEWLYTYNNPYG